MSVNAKIQFEKISAARRGLKGGGNFDCATGTVNNCTATINNKETSFTCPFGKPYETSPAAVWVCGNKAFHSMPKHGWSGCCYPALINVGTSVYLPNKTPGGRAKRNVKILPGVLPNHYSG